MSLSVATKTPFYGPSNRYCFVCLQEKESAVERWHEAEQEIDRLQQQLQVCSYRKKYEMSLCTRKPTIWVPTRSDTNQAVQSQKMVRG